MGAVCPWLRGSGASRIWRGSLSRGCDRRDGVGLYGRLNLQRTIAVVGQLVRLRSFYRAHGVVADRLVLGGDASHSRSGDRYRTGGVG